MVLPGVKKILIVNLGGIGDLLLSFPAVRALRETYADASIDIMVVDRVSELAEDAKLFTTVHVYGACAADTVSLLLRLRRNRYDLLINMRTIVSWRGAFKIFLIARMIRARVNAGRNTDGRGFFFDRTVPETGCGDTYEMEYDIDMVEALGAHVSDKTVRFDVGTDDTAAVTRLLADHGIIASDRLIGIHAGGAPSRRWPLAHFMQAMQLIHASIPCTFVLTGSAAERAYVDALAHIHGLRAINLAGEVTLRQLGAVIRHCDLYIANDTGPIHIAAALDAPLVALFGPGHLIRYDPRRLSEKAVVVHKPQPCAPCNRVRCHALTCLWAITPDEVAAAAMKGLRVDH